jgi:hypothetical protein
MNLFKFDGTNSVQHWVNPLKIARVSFTPETTETTFPPPTFPEPDPPAEPIITVVPASLVVHLDNGFAIQVADNKEDLLDKLDKFD